MNNIRVYDNLSQQKAAINSSKMNILSRINGDDEIYFISPNSHLMPLTFENIDSDDISITLNHNNSDALSVSMLYSYDNVIWESFTTDTSVTIPLGKSVYIKNSADIGRFNSSKDNYNYFECDGLCNVSGNIMSLGYNDFIGKNSTEYEYAYSNIFIGMDTLSSAKRLILPALTSTSYCYYRMFYGCSILIDSPNICCAILNSHCYEEMFYNCNKLHYITAFFTTTPSDEYTKDWVHGVGEWGLFTKGDDSTWDVTGDNGVPENWVVKYEGGEIYVKDISVSSPIYPNTETATVSYTIVFENTGKEVQKQREVQLEENLTRSVKTYHNDITDSVTFSVDIKQGYYTSLSNPTVITNPISAETTLVEVGYRLNMIDGNETLTNYLEKTTEFEIPENETENDIAYNKTISDKGLTCDVTFVQDKKINIDISFAEDCVFYVPLKNQTKTDYFTNVEGVPKGSSSTCVWDSAEQAYKIKGYGVFNCGLIWPKEQMYDYFSNTIDAQANGYTIMCYAKFSNAVGNGYQNYMSASSLQYGYDGNRTSVMAGYCPARNNSSTDSGWHWYTFTLKVNNDGEIKSTVHGYRDGSETYTTPKWGHTYKDTDGKFHPVDVALADITTNCTYFEMYAKDARIYNRVLSQSEISQIVATGK